MTKKTLSVAASTRAARGADCDRARSTDNVQKNYGYIPRPIALVLYERTNAMHTAIYERNGKGQLQLAQADCLTLPRGNRLASLIHVS